MLSNNHHPRAPGCQAATVKFPEVLKTLFFRGRRAVQKAAQNALCFLRTRLPLILKFFVARGSGSVCSSDAHEILVETWLFWRVGIGGNEKEFVAP